MTHRHHRGGRPANPTSDPIRTRRGRSVVAAPAAALATLALLVAASGAASADGTDGDGGLLHGTRSTVEKATDPITKPVTKRVKDAGDAVRRTAQRAAGSSGGSARSTVEKVVPSAVRRSVPSTDTSSSSGSSGSSDRSSSSPTSRTTSRLTADQPAADASDAAAAVPGVTPVSTALVDAVTNLHLDDLVRMAVGSSLTTFPAATPAGAPASGQDYAYSDLVNLNLGSLDLFGVGRNRSTGTQDGSKADATLLAVLGRELVGAHADSNGKTSDSPKLLDLDFACTMTAGQACVDVTSAKADASRTATTRDSATSTAVAGACLLGSDPSGATCDGLAIGAGESKSQLHSDSTTGTSTASGESSVADLCLKSTTGCLLNADLLTSRTSSDNRGHASSSSTVAGAGVNGAALGVNPTGPTSVSVPGSGPAALLSVLLNQNGTALGQGSGSASSTPVGLAGIGTTLAGDVGSTGTATSGADVVQPPAAGDPGTDTPARTQAGGAASGDRAADNAAASAAQTARVDSATRAGSDDGVLPSTGGTSFALLAWGLVLVVSGLMVTTVRRRRLGWL